MWFLIVLTTLGPIQPGEAYSSVTYNSLDECRDAASAKAKTLRPYSGGLPVMTACVPAGTMNRGGVNGTRGAA